jgi:hypothetical protein
MKNLLSATERARNERLRQLHLQREKASQNQNKVVNQGNKPRYLTADQMDKVKTLQREKEMTREEAVAWVLENMKSN